MHETTRPPEVRMSDAYAAISELWRTWEEEPERFPLATPDAPPPTPEESAAALRFWLERARRRAARGCSGP